MLLGEFKKIKYVKRKFTNHKGKYRNLHKSKQDHWFRGKFWKDYIYCIITSRHQNMVQTQNIVIENLSFENVEKLKYLGVMVAYQ